MRASVVVPTRDRPELLARCLSALAAQDLPRREYEVIVADDAADERTRRVVERFRGEGGLQVEYVIPSGRGPAAARNAGWRLARAPVVAFTDDDCMPSPGWLRAGLSAFTNGVAGASGRTVLPVPLKPTDHEANAARLSRALFITANCFIRRDALEAIGGLNESYPRAWREDSDLYFRLVRYGRPVVRVDEALVVHPIRPAAWGVSIGLQRMSVYNAMLYRDYPDLYRVHIEPSPPYGYYLTVAAGLGSMAGLAAGRRRPAVACGCAWAALTTRFFLSRLRGTSHSPSHVAEMLVTSAIVPPLSVFWRLAGAVRYRVAFA